MNLHIITGNKGFVGENLVQYLENKNQRVVGVSRNANNNEFSYRIKWNSNFEYELIRINPETQLDSTPFIIRITSISNNSYSFSAHYKGSNFKQKGKAVKVKSD